MSEKWAVVVVHGVGFRKPGETLENFFRVVSEQRGLFGIGAPQIRQLDCSETTPFPMYLRNAETDTEQHESTVFAEVYWGDLSKSGSSMGHLMLRMLTIVFHLRYLIDCAAAHPQTNWLAKFQRLIFVGTSIVGDGPFPHRFPSNVELKDLGGHMKYWNRIDVVKKLNGLLPGVQRS